MGDAVGVLLIGVVFVILILGIGPMRKDLAVRKVKHDAMVVQHEAERATWERSFLCHRCGLIFELNA